MNYISLNKTNLSTPEDPAAKEQEVPPFSQLMTSKQQTTVAMATHLFAVAIIDTKRKRKTKFSSL